MENDMTFQVGDQVIHQFHGPGVITGIEEKRVSDRDLDFFVVATASLTIWVPVEGINGRIRLPLSKAEFEETLNLFLEAPSPLPGFHRERKNVLTGRMNTADLAEVCRVIRDLAARSPEHAPNRNDKQVMAEARDLLLNEWEIVTGASRSEAADSLDKLLRTA